MGQYDSWDYLTNFIRKNPDTFEEELAKPPYSVKVKRLPDRPNLVMFKYSQFDSDFTNRWSAAAGARCTTSAKTEPPGPTSCRFSSFPTTAKMGPTPSTGRASCLCGINLTARC